jgi:hypothetical protein
MMTMDAQDFVTMVIDGLNVALAVDDNLSLADIAGDLGYAVNTLQQFRAGTCRSVRLATDLALAFPDYVGSAACPHCRCLPTLTYAKART